MGARKATRDFEQRTAPGYRCDLIPGLAALTPGAESGPGEVRRYWSLKAEGQPFRRLQDGEELSAIALAKRLFPDHQEQGVSDDAEAFPSTSSLASADFKADVLRAAPDNPAVDEAITAYEKAMEPLLGDLGGREAPVPALEPLAHEAGHSLFAEISGEWLFAESLDADRLDRQDRNRHDESEIDGADRKRAMHALRELVDAAGEAGIDGPSRYFGLVLLDGDNMGKWLSGAKRPSEGPVDRAYHQAVSRALSVYAGKHVPAIVEDEHLGRVVYSGGDDVMAFSSLRDALPMARSLRAAFSGQRAEDGSPDWSAEPAFTASLDAESPTLGKTGTASAGVVFAHHMQPLEQVLARARQAESEAKDTLGRDALACSVMKRSGERLTAGGAWHEEGTDLVDSLRRFAVLLEKDAVSSGFLHTVADEAPVLESLAEEAPAAARKEVRRIFERQSDAGDGAYEATVGALLDHTSFDRAVRLLETAQFIGKKGAR
jgi:CRISPR-associated protein Cmr2